MPNLLFKETYDKNFPLIKVKKKDLTNFSLENSIIKNLNQFVKFHYSGINSKNYAGEIGKKYVLFTLSLNHLMFSIISAQENKNPFKDEVDLAVFMRLSRNEKNGDDKYKIYKIVKNAIDVINNMHICNMDNDKKYLEIYLNIQELMLYGQNLIKMNKRKEEMIVYRGIRISEDSQIAPKNLFNNGGGLYTPLMLYWSKYFDYSES